MRKHRLSRITWALIATVSLVCSWLVLFVLERMGWPVWPLSIDVAVLLLSLAGGIALLYHATLETGEDQDHGRGGRRRPVPDAPRPDGGGDPVWWPEFERELARYTAETSAAVSPGPRREPLVNS